MFSTAISVSRYSSYVWNPFISHSIGISAVLCCSCCLQRSILQYHTYGLPKIQNPSGAISKTTRAESDSPKDIQGEVSAQGKVCGLIFHASDCHAGRRRRSAFLIQQTALSSISTDDRRALAIAEDAECTESTRDLLDRPCSKLRLEMKLARINKDVDDVASILENATDPSITEYLVERQPCIQRTVDTSRASLCHLPEPTTACSQKDTDDFAIYSTPNLMTQPSSVSDQSSFVSALETLDPSPGEILQKLKAHIRQQKVYNAVAWSYARNRPNASNVIS